MNVGEQDRENFQRDGYFVFDPDIPPSVLDGILADLDGKYESAEPLDVPYRDKGRIQDAWKISKHVKTVALFPAILKTLSELYNRKPLPFQTLNFPKGTEQAVHSDTVHFNSIPPGFMCGVWVALEDIDMENGPLLYYPGSHKFPEINEKDLEGVSGGGSFLPRSSSILGRFSGYFRKKPSYSVEERYAVYERMVANRIAESGIQPAYGTIKKGQVLIWSANLLHGGAMQKDRTRTRNSQVTHYFFEGCRYYTPLLSGSEALHLRSPEWIR
jgi:ectoine hydroxylase-related dioxygenase (phytanoyl-CoA dioxygenase family)